MSPKNVAGDEKMVILEANQVKVYIGDRLLIDIENIQIQKNDRIGLVGKNGCGKTTFMSVLAGEREADAGTVHSFVTSELLPQLKRQDQQKSGGEVTKEYINHAIARKSELLFADEPTTHLDTEHIEWLEKKFNKWRGALVITSHDRTFLDALCTKIWEIKNGKLTEYKGNYSDYVQQKELEKRQEKEAYEIYEKKKKQLEEALKLKVRKAERATKTPKHVSHSEASITGAKPYFAKKQKKLQKAANAIETRLEKLEKVEKVRENAPLKMNIKNEQIFKNRMIMRIEGVSGEINGRILWNKASFQIKGGDKLAIIGENGSGKTTFIKKIINEAEGITISPAVKCGYFSQGLDILNKERTILENVSEHSLYDETFIRTLLARLHFFTENVYKKVGVLSGGERVKVALAKLFLSDINTLILDEPTNFLDIEAVEALEALLSEYEGSVIFVSHDRRFIENIATRIVHIHNNKLTVFDGSYRKYQESKEVKEDGNREDILLIEMKLSEVLSRLSIAPTKELEAEFQELLAKKRQLNN